LYSVVEIKQRIFDIHGNLLILDESTYVNTKTKARFVHKERGEWWVIPKVVLRGQSFRRSSNIQDIKNRLHQIHGDEVQIDENSFIDVHSKCRFVDKDYGEFFNSPHAVINRKSSHPHRKREKTIQTCLKRYGVDNPMKVKEIQDKNSLSSNSSGIVYHWKTGTKMVWKGGYELKILEYWNSKKIDFIWHPETFSMIDGRTYTPDAYLIDKDLYIEIKGWHRGDSEEKWNWFHRIYPNSEIWFKENIEKLGVNTRSK